MSTANAQPDVPQLAPVLVTATRIHDPQPGLEDPFFGPDLIAGLAGIVGKGLGILGIRLGTKLADDLVVDVTKKGANFFKGFATGTNQQTRQMASSRNFRLMFQGDP